MCTVTYYPTELGGYILTSNRDERKDRPIALPPQKYIVHSEEVIFPKDPEGGGTWIASHKQCTLCLLNGADVFHQKEGPYRKSRGLVLLDYFKFMSVTDFANNEILESIEPFTLVIVEHKNGKLTQLRWNGSRVNLLELDPSQPHIWSSYTLYTEEVIVERESWFLEFNQQPNHTAEQILHFHKFGGTGNMEQDLVMTRIGKVQTVSITQINYRDQHWMKHLNLIKLNETKIYV